MISSIGPFQVILMIFMIVVIPIVCFVLGYMVGSAKGKSKMYMTQHKSAL